MGLQLQYFIDSLPDTIVISISVMPVSCIFSCHYPETLGATYYLSLEPET